MTILPRSSVRPDSTNPPSKKSRLQQNPPISRRKSSPDLLDTSLPPDPSSLLPPPVSSPATPRHRILEPSYDTPSASAALDDRDSPDPLDTITPVTSTKTPTTSAITGSDAASKSSSDSARSSRSSLPNPPAVDSTEKKIPETSTAPAPTTVQPPKSVPDPPATGRRSLRSQDVGSRAKCELANYFHNYEELLSLVPPKSESLVGDTTVNLIDDLTSPPVLPNVAALTTESPFGNPLINLHNCEVIELPNPPQSKMEDPLNEGTYFRAHRRAERQEKQLRNIERERAQHEKLQVDRLLDELKGQDWIRVLGIHGINDAEKKLYEPKRAFFIHELSLLIEKFNLWRAEEKRRKVDKPFARADTTPPSTAKSHSTGSKRRGAKPKKIPVEDDLTLNGSAFLSDSGDPPDTDDVDACAARQLHQEARSAGKQRKNSSEKRKTTRSVHPPEQPHPGGAAAQTQTKTPAPTPTTFAFGYPVPHMEEREFHLPSDILNEESIQASRRKLRRLKRERRAE